MTKLVQQNVRTDTFLTWSFYDRYVGDVWGWQTLVAEAAETDNITALMSRALPQMKVVIMKLLFVVVQYYNFLRVSIIVMVMEKENMMSRWLTRI